MLLQLILYQRKLQILRLAQVQERNTICMRNLSTTYHLQISTILSSKDSSKHHQPLPSGMETEAS